MTFPVTPHHTTPHHAVPYLALQLQVWYAIAYVGKYADELEGEAPVATPAVPAPDDAYIDAFSRYVHVHGYGRQAGGTHGGGLSPPRRPCSRC